jgi:hypothetical protein
MKIFVGSHIATVNARLYNRYLEYAPIAFHSLFVWAYWA